MPKHRSNPRTSKQRSSTRSRKSPRPKRASGGLAQAGRNALAGGVGLAFAAGETILARLTRPSAGEAARMIPEKLLAAASAGNAWMLATMRAGAALQAMAMRESAEAFTVARKLATAAPLDVLHLQQQAACDALARAAGAVDTFATDALQAQASLIRPFLSAARANARRLRR